MNAMAQLLNWCSLCDARWVRTPLLWLSTPEESLNSSAALSRFILLCPFHAVFGCNLPCLGGPCVFLDPGHCPLEHDHRLRDCVADDRILCVTMPFLLLVQSSQLCSLKHATTSAMGCFRWSTNPDYLCRVFFLVTLFSPCLTPRNSQFQAACLRDTGPCLSERDLHLS